MARKFWLNLVILLIFPFIAHAWGGRGHHSICSVATHLVQEPGLKAFMTHRPHIMGHLCNIPDIYWKSLKDPEAQKGSFTHYINPESLGLKVMEVGLDYKALGKEFIGKEHHLRPGRKILSLEQDLGSVWWRVDQFMRRVMSLKSDFAKAKKPKDRQQEQQDSLLYNQTIYQFMINMGLMGHFVGDSAQPLHNSADYDGYGTGHGGLHSYFEEIIVAVAPADLEAQVYQEALSIKDQPWMKKGTVVEQMRAFSAQAYAELPRVRELDPVVKKSTVKHEKGMEIREIAQRKSPEEGWKALGPIVIQRMGAASRMLAQQWDEAYRRAGKPDLSAYRSYRYPFTPDYIPPDYLRD